MDSAEQRIGIAANRLYFAVRLAKQFLKNEAAAAMHGIDHDLQFRLRNPVPINERSQVIERRNGGCVRFHQC